MVDLHPPYIAPLLIGSRKVGCLRANFQWLIEIIFSLLIASAYFIGKMSQLQMLKKKLQIKSNWHPFKLKVSTIKFPEIYVSLTKLLLKQTLCYRYCFVLQKESLLSRFCSGSFRKKLEIVMMSKARSTVSHCAKSESCFLLRKNREKTARNGTCTIVQE